jgi:hypothetical protein
MKPRILIQRVSDLEHKTQGIAAKVPPELLTLNRTLELGEWPLASDNSISL